MHVVKLNKKGYQAPNAEIKVTPETAKPGENITIEGKNFTGFLKRGNPGAAILFDEKPLTGIKLKQDGRFKINMKLPPFEPGNHIISVFGIGCPVNVMEDETIVTQGQLIDYIKRDFKVDENAHLLFSDDRYKICPYEELKCYLSKTDVPNKRYIAEWFDCDDFSDALHGQYTYDTYPKGYAHGEIWVTTGPDMGHAINCWLVKYDDGNIKMVLVEPQTGKIFDFPNNWTAFMIKI